MGQLEQAGGTPATVRAMLQGYAEPLKARVRATIQLGARRPRRSRWLKDFHFHDLRHHGAAMALNAGFTAPIVMQLGGWKSDAMMRRYVAVTDQTLRAAAEAVAGGRLGAIPADPWLLPVPPPPAR